MKKLLVLLLSSTLCFSNAFLTVKALEDDPVPSEEPTEEVNEGNEESVPEEPLETDEPEVIDAEPEEQSTDDAEESAEQEKPSADQNTGTEEEKNVETESEGAAPEVIDESLENEESNSEDQELSGGKYFVSGDEKTNNTESENEEESEEPSDDFSEMALTSEEAEIIEEQPEDGMLLNAGEAYSEDGKYKYYMYNYQNAEILKYLGNETNIVVPSRFTYNVGGSYLIPVTAIGSSAFFTTTTVNLESVTIPSSVKTIRNSAFESCINLSQITLSEGLEVIERNAFYNCRSLNLQEITIPSTVKTIGTAAFAYCNFKKLTILSDDIDISFGAFRDNPYLKTAGPLNSGSNIEFCWADKIPSNALSDITSLRSIVIPNTVNEIGTRAFDYCIGLKTVTIPSSVTVIKEGAFDRDNALSTVYYYGTREEWNNVVIQSENDPLLNANVICMRSPETPFTIKHFQEDIEGDTYTLIEEEVLYGYPESTILLNHYKKNYPGFSYDGGYLTGDVIRPEEGEVTETTITVDGSTTINQYYTRNKYAVIWKNYNGNVLETDLNAPYGTKPSFEGTAPTKPRTDEFSYTHNGWNTAADGTGTQLTDESIVNGTVTYFAQFTSTKNKYTITWNIDGTETAEEFEYGEMPSHVAPTKQGDVQYTYTFAGWDPEIEQVIGNQSYTARFNQTLKKYNVTWKDWDGTELEVDENVPYGSAPSYDSEIPSRPSTAQYTYSFAGWTPSVDPQTTRITGDTAYTATYNQTVNQYTVTWKNWDGTVLETDETVEYGVTPEYNGNIPERAEDETYTYTFKGWTPEISDVTGDAEYTASFNRKEKAVHVTGVKLNKTTLTLVKDKTETLKATVSPSDATNKKVTWSSSNTKIVTVDSKGKVTAKSAGTATITVKTADGGKTATCKVTVKISVTGVKLNKTSLSLGKGKSTTLTATISPSNATNKKVTWTSSNTKIATVDSNGKVTGKAPGTATITVTTADGKKTATCKVTVKASNACKTNGFCRINGKDYWYENGVRQGTSKDPKGVIGDGTNRGREIFDSDTKAWYWLDAAYDGAKAVGKEVWMPYIYQDEANWSDADKRKMAQQSDAGMEECIYNAMKNKSGKWVRYDQNGKMLKGWVPIEGELAKLYPNQRGNTYYYDTQTGLMAKGYVTLGGTRYHFDEVTGELRR